MTDKERPISPFSIVDGGKKDMPETPPLTKPAVNDEGVQQKLAKLQAEHRDLDQAIAIMEERMPYERISLQRMKKRKLILKDMIVALKDQLHPDIIA